MSGLNTAAGVVAGRPFADGISCVAFQPSYMLQSEELRASLLARYPPEKLFQADRNFNAAQDLDVSLLEGDVVGVIKKKDPMGSQNRWLIDNGGKGAGQRIPGSERGSGAAAACILSGRENERLWAKGRQPWQFCPSLESAVPKPLLKQNLSSVCLFHSSPCKVWPVSSSPSRRLPEG